MTSSEWENVDEELDFIIDAAESAIGIDDESDLKDALDDIARSIGRIKAIKNGTVGQ